MHLRSATVQCPYCWESIELDIDTSVPEQSYIEDCQVCCRPISIAVHCSPDGQIQVSAQHEDA